MGDYFRFQVSGTNSNSNTPVSSLINIDYRVLAHYNAISTFNIKAGAYIATSGTAGSIFLLDFSKGADFGTNNTSAVSYTSPTVNSQTTNNQTPTLTGTYSATVTNSSATVTNITVTVGGTTYTTSNGLIYSNGSWSLTTNTLANGTYDVVVNVTYSSGVTVHDGSANELTINTALVADNTLPTLTSITRNNPTAPSLSSTDLTSQNYVILEVTFSEPVTSNMSLDDYALSGTGTSGASISSIQQSGESSYLVRVSNIPSTNVGTLGIVLSSSQNLVDDAGNLLTNTDPTSGINENYNLGSSNSAPIAISDTVTYPEDTTGVFIDVQNNDSDLEGNSLTTTILSGPNHGTASVSNGDSISYTPTANWNGIDTIVYRICDNGTPSLCDTAFVFITITPVNDAPIAISDTVTYPEDTTGVYIDVQVNDSDPEGNSLTTSIISGPSHGTTSVSNGDSISYAPMANWNGLDTIVYRICDNGTPSMCDTASVFITVTPVNDAPIAISDTVTYPEDTTGVFIDVQNNDSDLEGNSLTTSIISGPSHGTASVSNGDSISYAPTANWNGLDTIVYRICDDGTPSLCDTAFVFITVTPVNDPPVAVADNETTNEDATDFKVPVLDNDSDPENDNLTVTIEVQPTSGGTASVLNDSVIYNPPANWSGNDTILYQICDNGTPVECDVDTIFITVNPVNDAPIAISDTVTYPEDTTGIYIDVQVNDSDPEGNSLTTSIISGPSHGTASVSNSDSINYAPTANWNGIDTIVYRICDNGTPSLCDTASVFISVTPDNDAPIAISDIVTYPEDTTGVFIDVQNNDSDLEGNSLTTTILSGPSHGTASVSIGDSISYAPTANWNGIDTIVYRICDNGTPSLCDTASVFITVTPVNDPPVAVNDTFSFEEGSTNYIGLAETYLLTKSAQTRYGLLLNDYDIDSELLTAVKMTDPIHGNLTIYEDGSFIYIHDGSKTTIDSFTYNINDGLLWGDTATVILNIYTYDTDGDGVVDSTEVSDLTDPNDYCSFLLEHQTDSTSLEWKNADCDGDGVTNKKEILDGTDPLDNCSFILSSQTVTPDSNWNNADCDKDGVTNNNERKDGTDPLDNCSFVVSSQTLTPDTEWGNADCDDDGVSNKEELSDGTDPLDKDSDNDGVPDGTEKDDDTDPLDNCSFMPEHQTLLWNTTDYEWRYGDCDGDGVVNVKEKLDGTDPLDPCSLILESRTKEPTANWDNTDCDNDGISNKDELNDGTDPKDPDTDGDGVTDGKEKTDVTNPLDPCSFILASQMMTPDADWDTTDCDNDGVTNKKETEDGTDPLDPDTDGDGVTDGDEKTDGTDPLDNCSLIIASQTLTPDTSWENADCDNDGETNKDELTDGTDPFDPDTDGDGVTDGKEKTDDTDPLDPCSFILASQTMTPDADWDTTDCDNDSIQNKKEIEDGTDPLDPDTDGDGVTDGKEKTDGTDPLDPCSYILASQTMTPDADWDIADCDNDGVSNKKEKEDGTDPFDPDTDGDGVTDGQEKTDGTNPIDNCSFILASQTLTPDADWDTTDCDNDGVTNKDEKNDGSDPNNPDTDGDGVTDGKEKTDSTNPLDNCSLIIASQTLTPDASWESADCDSDGISNGDELVNGTDPLKPEVIAPKDSDGDGVTDEQEAIDGTNPLDPCSLNIDSQTETPGTDWENMDCDGDGLSNLEEIESGTNPFNTDSDGNGISDAENILISKTSDDTQTLPDGALLITYTIKITNLKPYSISDLVLTDDLTQVFPSGTVFEVTELTSDDNISLNPGYNGSSDSDLLSSGNSLAVYQAITIVMTVKFYPYNFSGSVYNTAVVSGQTLWRSFEKNSIDINHSNGRVVGEGLPTVNALPEIGVEIFDIVTPNGDGFNDSWIISRSANQRISVKLFNRWGQLVYENPDYMNTWDGNGHDNFLGDRVTPGTYYYLVDIINRDSNQSSTQKGYITLKF